MTVRRSPSLPPTLARVMAGQTCSGCGLCAGIDPAIGLERDAKGWLRPVALAEALPGTDALLAKACPGATVAPWEGGESRAVDPYWGPHVRVMTAHATDPEVRHMASSGGTLSALALHLLETGAVDRVLHVGMDVLAPLLTTIVRSAGRDDILRAAGSRYAPAAPLAEIRAELEQPGRILFIGKPCDAGALRQLMAADPAVAERFPYLFSFFCAGTPSQDGTERIVHKLGMEKAEVAHFRYRGDGWPGFATATRADGSSERMTYSASWGDILSKEVQFRCKICPDAVGGVADVAAADAWYGGESGYPAFEEMDGRSLLISRTARGDAMVKAAEAAGTLTTEPLDIGEIIKMQPSQARRKRLAAARMAAMALTGNPGPVVDGLKVGEAARLAGLIENVKSCAGTMRRILSGNR
ncbi:MAG: Coenzyme F420 hydrogenase/dehydrogenase, beta subunit C-terminal domain [Sandarakinorhabdus sp.]|nr:Coenzyme F420 hydrogenase/dehydrogenase, beta subunit C-terminal domain [Sandarakinorhabdus sp.]